LELIYTIPGLGTTKDLFKNISVQHYSLKVLDWPEPQANQSLKEYAKTFLTQIDYSKPVNLMGVSFGGMLCCEIADLLPTKNIVLISSCKNKNELPSRIKFLRFFPIQKLLTDRFYRRLIPKSSWIVGFQKKELPEFKRMAEAMPPNYFKWCIHKIINWSKLENTQIIHHLHGNADRLLPHSNIRNFNVINNGNHAMIIYKADEINKHLNKIFNGL
jgi:pimeloyl-ACP methyl ester carboxylesterase